MRFVRPIGLTTLLSVLLLSTGALAAERLPAERAVVLIFTALAYDRNLQANRDGAVRVGVVYGSGGEGEARSVQDAIASQARRMTLKGLPIRVERLAAESASQAVREIGARGINLIFLAPGLADSTVDAIASHGKSNKKLIVTHEGDYTRRGAAVLALLDGSKPKLVVDLEAARAQGADFPARILRLAEVL